MTTLHYDLKPFSWFSSWLSILLLAAISTACGGGGGGGDQGREPILGLPSASLVALNISPLTSSVQISGLQQYVATASYADGSSRVVSTESTWSSSVVASAKISTTGAAQGVGAGSTVITAQFSDKTASANLIVLPATLTSMAVTPLNPSIPKGSQQIFKAIGTYSDGSSKDISTISNFTASNATIANMAVNGVATALLVGTTPIVASSGGLSATTNLTVTPAILVQLAILPSNPTLLIGTTQALTVTASYSDGNTTDVSNSSVFTAATPAVAKVTANSGIVTAITPGTSMMTAVFNGMSVSTTVTVAPTQLVSIVVTPGSANVFIAGTQSFVATGTYSDGSTANISNAVAWTSSDVTKATILPTGVATGLTVSSDIMTATLNAKSGSGTLIVSLPISLVSIDVTPNTAAIFVSETQAFIATALYSDNTTANISNLVSWISSNTTRATILPTGIATGFNAGTTNIIANYQNKSDSSPLTVSVVPTLVGIDLGVADSFAVLAGASITNNAGGLTLVTGDVGSPSQTVDPVQVAGYTNYKSGAILANALADLQVAISDANSRACTVTSASGIDLGGLTLSPGIYCYAGAINITGTFTMNGPGLYIFRTSSTINSAANSIVALNAGASAGNVFWVPTSASTLGANSVFKGTIMANASAITMGDMANLQNGRILSASAVTLRNNVISR